MKKVRFGIIAAALILVLMAGCAPKKAAPAAASSAPFRVGVQPVAMGVPAAYALEKGYFAAEGLAIDLLVFPTGVPINEAMAAKELDIAMSGAASLFPLATGDFKMLSDINSSGGMGIWTRADSDIMKFQGQAANGSDLYGSAESIRGKSFLCPLGTAAQFNVLRYIAQFGLTDADINTVHMEFGQAAQAFMAGEGDAIAILPPFSIQLEANGGVKVGSFEDATDIALCDMVYVSNELLAARRGDLVKYMRAIYKAMDDMADKKVRKEFTQPWFASEGRVFDDEAMDQEMIDRIYFDRQYISNPNYVFGEALLPYAEFFVKLERIEQNDIENVKKCLDPSLMEEALGIKVKLPNWATK